MAEQSNWKGTLLFLGIILQVHCKNLYWVQSDAQYFFFWNDCKAQAFAFCRHSAQTGLTTTMRKVLDGGKDFANLYSQTILPLAPQPSANKHICRLHACHPGLINMLQTHCKNCLILLWAFSPTVFNRKKYRDAKGCGLGSGIMGTHWPRQHVSFHASFIHFITSLDECEGVEGKPCHPETEREELYSIFPSPGPALLSACSAACLDNIVPGEWGGV